jgi:hypothetical protein
VQPAQLRRRLFRSAGHDPPAGHRAGRWPDPR